VLVLEKQIERQQWWNAPQNVYHRVNHVSLPSASYPRADELNASFSQCADDAYTSRAANLQVLGSNSLSSAVSPATSNQTSLRLDMQQSFGASTPLKQVPPNPQIPTEFVNSARSALLSQPNSSLVASSHAINSNNGNVTTSTRSPAGAINQYEEQKAVSKQSDSFALGTSVAAKTSDNSVKSASSTQQITGRSLAGFTQPATVGNQGISAPFATSRSPAASTQPATGGSQGVFTQFGSGGSPAAFAQPATGGSQGVFAQFGSGGSPAAFAQPATGGSQGVFAQFGSGGSPATFAQPATGSSQGVFTQFGSGGSLAAFAQPATVSMQAALTQPAIGGIQTAKSGAKPPAVPTTNQRTGGQQMPVSQGEKAVVTSTAHSQLIKQDATVSSAQKPFAGGGFNFSGSIPPSATKGSSSSFSGATSSATLFGTATSGSKFLPSSTSPAQSLLPTTTSSVATSANVVNLSVSSSSTLPNKENENMFNKQQRPDSSKTAPFAVTSTVGNDVASKPVTSVSSASSFVTGYISSDKNAGITTSSQAVVSRSVGVMSTTTSSGASILSTQPVKSLFGEGQNVPSFADLAKQSSSLPFAKKLPVDNKEIIETVPPVFCDTRTNSQQRSSEGIDDDNEQVDEYEPDVSFKPVISLPAIVEVKTGEELEEKVFGERAKLYRLDDDKQWKERGIGEIKIMKHKDTGKYRIVMRREQVLKVCANHYITADMKLLAKGDTSWCWIAQDFADDSTKVEQFCAKFKNIEIAQKFQEAFMEGCSGDSGAKQATTAKGTTSLAELLKSPGCAASNASAAVSSGALTVVTAQTSSVPAASGSLIVKQDQLTTGEIKPLSELFKKAEGEWDCSSCYVRNKSSSLKCPACNTPKPAEQMPSTLTTVVTANQSNKQAVTSEDNKPLSELFKKAEGEWDCSSCYVRNKSTVLKCPACDSPKPGTNAAAPVQPLASTTGTLQFGAQGGFQFGSVKSDVSSMPANSVTAANKTVGSFGGFNFTSNQPTVGKASDTAATSQPVKPFAGFSFTSNQPTGQADNSTTKAVIQPSSAVSTTASMAAQFSFITTSSSQPASTTTKGFSFVQPSSTQATSASTWQPVGGFTSAVSLFSNEKPKESSTSKISYENNSLTSSGGVLAPADDG
jgi:rubrerythrin